MKIAKIKNFFTKIIAKIRATTTISSIVVIIAVIASIIVFDRLTNPSGALFAALRGILSVFLFFLLCRINELMKKEKYHRKKMDIEKEMRELRADGFSITEATSILNNRVLQENSMHEKIARRNLADKIATAMLTALINIFGTF